MRYFDFKGNSISRLGFGLMRLPLLESGELDEVQIEQMIDYAMSNGINYFDTAWPYHGGMSELMVGKYLTKYPRESYYLANKYPGHQISDKYDPADIFERQLKKCNVAYFDFYLLHNVTESSIDVYEDKQWGIIDYFIEQKKEGRIKHLGFSSHGTPELLAGFLERHGRDMEFCQLQFNFLDYTLQDAKKKLDILIKHNIPMWVMEPLRGGKLAEDRDSAFRWIETNPNLGVILSGMSNLDQLKDNIDIFSREKILTDAEVSRLMKKADELRNTVPCTACGYCKEGCPMQLDIPKLMATYNDAKFVPGFTPSMYIEFLPEDKKPSACIGCGACAQICPQKIDIPGVMKDFANLKLLSWRKLCEEREAAAKKLESK